MITSIVKIELQKLHKSRISLITIILLVTFLCLSFILTYSIKDTRYVYEVYLYYVFATNSKFLFPFTITVMFTLIVTDEFNNNTIAILSRSIFSKVEIFIGKFIAGVIVFFGSFSILVLIYFFFINIFVKINSSQIVIAYSKQESIKRFMIICSTQIVYLLCFAIFAYTISWIVGKKSVTMIIIIAILIAANLYPPIPYNISRYIFLMNYSVFTTFFDQVFNIYTSFKNISVNILTAFIFFMIGIVYIPQKEF